MTRPSLTSIEQRIAAATAGPWFLDATGDSGVFTEPRVSDTSQDVASAYRAEDEAFIAHARADVPALTAALRAVLRFHTEREHRPLDGIYLGGTVCDHCRRTWPCATVHAITAHIDTTPKEN